MQGKIIVIAIKAGGGHIAAMHSIISSLTGCGYQVDGYVSNQTSVNKVYEFFNFKLPMVYDIGYNLADFKAYKISQGLLIQDILNDFEAEFSQFFKDESVKKIISTHFLTTEVLLELKQRFNSNIEIFGYVPDYDTSLVHFPYAYSDYMNGFIAQSYSLLNRVANEYNYPRSSLKKGGFIANKEFAEAGNQSKSNIYKNFKGNADSIFDSISEDKFKILIAGGSGWTGTISSKIRSLIFDLESALANIQFIVISGSNPSSIQRYKKLKKEFPNADIIILPKLNQLDLAKIYSIADLVLLASIAPASLFELMESKAAPIILVKTNPGQETYNKNFAVEAGLVEFINGQSALNMRVLELLTNTHEYNRSKALYLENYKTQLENAKQNAKKMQEFIVSTI